MRPLLPSRHSRYLDAAIQAQIRLLERCRKRLRHVDPNVFEAGMKCFGSEAGFVHWLCNPARALGGDIPLHAMSSSRGRRKVEEVLVAITHGVYL